MSETITAGQFSERQSDAGVEVRGYVQKDPDHKGGILLGLNPLQAPTLPIPDTLIDSISILGSAVVMSSGGPTPTEYGKVVLKRAKSPEAIAFEGVILGIAQAIATATSSGCGCKEKSNDIAVLGSCGCLNACVGVCHSGNRCFGGCV